MSFDFSELLIRIPVLLFSITVHEYAHGRTALWLGDPTAKSMGRLTLNPLPHIDPFGAICLFLFNFGWAKPVPVNTWYFKNVRSGTILMSISGPATNLAVACLAGLCMRFFPMPWVGLQLLFVYLLFMNIGLGLFNLLPIPPLDGSHVMENLLPPKASLKYQSFNRYGPFVLIGIVLLDNFANTGIIARILIGPMKYLAGLFSGFNF